MKGALYALLICLIAILLILPIGIGAWTAISTPDTDGQGTSQPEELDVGLSISESEVTFNIGGQKTLTASTAVESGSYIFLWDSDNKNVVNVKKSSENQNTATITGMGEGTANISVSIIDVTKFKIVDTKTCAVTVIDSNISFNVDEVVISLEESKTASVTAKAPDGGVIAWASEDESIATVDANGVITAHKAGQVYIIARSGDISAKLLVKIYNSFFTLEEVKVVGAGQSEQIAVNGTIGEASWTSSDDRIATVDANGVVTAHKTGMVTVKATSVSDGLTSSCVVIVKAGNAEATELVTGKKADSAANAGQWYYLCESNNVTIGSIPTLDNGLIYADITNVGTSGANFFYLRYQPDAVGDVVYKHTLYIYSGTDNALIQLNGKDNYLKLGLNRIEIEFTSSTPKDINPYQIKFKAMGEFYILPIFEEISRIEKMTLSEETKTLQIGETFTLTATVPGQDNPVIEWVSSNSSVVTIENGVVTAVGEGSSMITAICGSYSATCFVNVQGATEIEGEELSKGNKSATLAAPGKWFYLNDGKTKLFGTPIMDKENNIHFGVESVDSANKKYAYLRYQPETQGTYKVTISIVFAGADGSVVDISGGNVSATPFTLKNGENTFEFTFTSDNASPFQMKFYSIGSYVVNVTFGEA